MSLIGSDPEFLILDARGEGVSARKVPILHDDWNGPLGSDGDNGELRPKAAPTVAEHVDNITQLLFRLGRTEYGAKAGSAGKMYDGGWGDDFLPLGGHIHFDLPWDEDGNVEDIEELELNDYSDPEEGQDLSSTSRLGRRLKMLDLYLALPMRLIDAPGDVEHRLHEGYGQLSDVRANEQHTRIEYRTLPSWLVSREWSYRALTLGRAIWELAELRINPRGWAKAWDQILYNGWALMDNKQLRATWRKFGIPVWNALMTERPELRSILPEWMEMISKGKKWNARGNLLENWPVVARIGPHIEMARGPLGIKRKPIEAVSESIAPPKQHCVLYRTQEGEGDEVVVDKRLGDATVTVGCNAPIELREVIRKELPKAYLVGMRATPTTRAQRTLEQIFKGIHA